MSAVGAKSLMSVVMNHVDHHHLHLHHSPNRLLSIKHRSKLKLLPRHHHWTSPTSQNGEDIEWERMESLNSLNLKHLTGAAPTSAGGSAPPPSAAAGASRSVSLASVSSDGSAESHLVEQEDIVALTQEVRAFKEALGKLRRLFHPPDGKEKCGGGSGGGSAAAAVSSAHDAPLRVAAHERLGEVLRILRIILERYPALQSTELLVAAGSLIHQVKEHPYDDERNDVKEFMESIDQLALAFSSRVSEYLMGDLDSNISLASSVSSKTKSCENLPSDVECAEGARVSAGAKEAAPSAPATSASEQQLNGQQMDAILLQLEQGVEVALHRAKLWSKYAKDVMSYVEKHCHLEMEYAKNVAKLAQTMKSTLKEECYLPFQSIYITAMDREIENCNLTQSTSAMLMGHKFLEPLAARRLEHERSRKQIKETWHRELKRMQEAVSNLRKAKALYVQRQQEWERAKEAAVRAENAAADNEQAKIDKRKRAEEDTLQKAMEAETVYKSCVSEANERHSQLFRVKGQVLQQIRELMLQCDQTMKAVTVSYYQLQHSVSAPAPVQFQTLCESSRLYEPGSQYMEFVRRMPLPNSKASGGREANQSLPPSSMGPMGSQAGSSSGPYSFEPYSEESATAAMLEKERKSNGSLSADSNESSGKERNLMSLPTVPIKAWGASSVGSHSNASSANAVGTQISSDTESVESSPSAKSRETSPTASPMMPARRLVPASSGDELENDQDTEVDGSYMGSYTTTRRHCMSKAAVTHTFRKLKTPSRCRECDSYVYFQGAECIECGLGCHKKCLESLTIQCGHKRLPRKMTTFGVDLSQHLTETGATVPHLLVKCIHEIDSRGIQIKGLYRVSGVKSKVEKLCQAFENGADLVDLTDIHPNVIANVLKLYLRQLPEPLLTSKLYPEFIRIAKECSELCPGSSTAPSTTPSATSSGASTSGPAACGPVPASVVDELRDLVHRLPRHHYSTLSFLMHHLKGVAMEAECNNMPSSNLGIVFGPTLLRTAEGSASLSSLVDTVHQTKVIELLIMNADDIFGAPSAAAHHHHQHQHQHHHHQPSVKEHPAKRSDEGSLLSKVPVVRSISFLDKHRKSRSDTETILSTPADRRAAACGGADPREEVTLPGFVAEQRKSGSLDIDHLSEESLGLGLTEDDGDEESDLPDFLLPDDSSGKTRKPLPYFRTGTAPKIFKASLKDYHGLEGVDLNLLSSQDQEVHHHHHHPQAHPQQRESVTSVASQPGGMGAESAAQPATAAAAAKASLLGPGHGHTPLMDSSIDSDHSWESVSTGSSGRGTQHSDQGSLGSAINATTTSSTTIQQQQQQRLGGVQDRDEIDGGRLDSVTLNSLTSLTARASINDENRVKIQVPSGAPLPRTSIGSSSSSSSSASSGGSSSSSPVSSSAGVVTVLEGPVSLSTVVESFSSADDKASGSWSSSSPSAAAACGASNRSVASESAATAHDVTHVFSSRSASSGAEPSAESTTSQRTKSGERVARFV